MDEAFHKTKHGREPCVPFLRRPRPSLDSYTRGRGLSLPQGVVPNAGLTPTRHNMYYGPYQGATLRRTPYLLGELRPCTHCECLLPRTNEFYAADKRSSDGYHSWCRDCQREKALAWQQDNREWAKANSRTHHRKNRNQNLASFQAWAKAHPLAAPAHHAVHEALRSGRLLMPDTCDACGKEDRVFFHHEDYTRPLWGTALCHSCHRKVHGARNLSP